jgi:hypothetical protein
MNWQNKYTTHSTSLQLPIAAIRSRCLALPVWACFFVFAFPPLCSIIFAQADKKEASRLLFSPRQ